jgi:xanthine dehydrogenase YagR molybdenum-binding subunit
MKRRQLDAGLGNGRRRVAADRFAAEANVQLRDDGTVRVASATQDIGTGTYTIMAQLAVEKTGVPLDKVEVVLGDSSLPDGPISGASMATESLIPAVFGAANEAIASLLIIASSLVPARHSADTSQTIWRSPMAAYFVRAKVLKKVFVW